jgi:hypothetical protein
LDGRGQGRTPIVTGMCSRANAEDEANELNRTVLAEYGPCRVAADVVAMDREET